MRPKRYAVTTEAGTVTLATSDELLDAYEAGRPMPVHVASFNCGCPRCVHVLYQQGYEGDLDD